jgi:hypothetical protein
LGAILHDASDEMIACNDVRTVAGYAAYGRSIKAAVEPLVGALGVDLLDDGSRLRSPSGDVVEIDAERELGAGVDDQAPHHQREQAPASRLPTTVRLSYYDPARDYQFGEARSSVGDEMRSEDQRDLPAVMNAAEAKAVAQQLVARAWAERDRMIIRLPPRHLAIEPGASIELPFAPGPWVVEQCTMEGFAAILELRRSAPSPAPAFSMNADAGRLLQAGPEIGEMTIALFEAPPMAEGSNDPTFLLAASSTGAGWRSSSVEVTVGAHRFIERTPRRKSVLGKALTGLTAKGGDLEVKLVDATQWLLSCDENALAEGANLAMLGCEMIQFGEAETLGDGRFRLSRLRRGCAGTEWAIAVHETGEDFVLLERDRLQPITIPGWLPASTIAARINPGAERPGKRAVLKSAKRPKKAS